MDIIQLIKILPDTIQNIIFYYITLHPIAILYHDYYSFYKLTLQKQDFILYRHGWYTSSKMYCELFKDYNLQNKERSKEDIESFIISRKILNDQNIYIEENLINKYQKNPICIKCKEVIIFNLIDNYCTLCIKKIRKKYQSIVFSDLFTKESLYN